MYGLCVISVSDNCSFLALKSMNFYELQWNSLYIYYFVPPILKWIHSHVLKGNNDQSGWKMVSQN